MTSPPWRVWVLDDSPLEARRAFAALEGRCEVTAFSDGNALLERLQMDAERPELLILDFMMPSLSGLDVCRFVRKAHDGVSLPVLMLTSTAEEETLLECFRAGANDFVTKPFRPAELLARVEMLASLSRAAVAARNRDAAAVAVLVSEARFATEQAHAEIVQKDRYIGILGHDLRNPLSAILVAAQLVERRGGESVRHAHRIQRSAARMALMIRDILDFARGKLAEGIPITRAPANLATICADVVDELTAANPECQLRLETEGDLTGIWDADRLQQAVSNLVGNAIEHGESAVDIRAVSNGDSVTVSVHNRGETIPPAEIAVLFEPFRKRDRSRAGLGLGLYIVREIVAAHGGTVSVSSEPEAGTTFTVALPRRS